jgi:hypothetical protein
LTIKPAGNTQVHTSSERELVNISAFSHQLSAFSQTAVAEG